MGIGQLYFGPYNDPIDSSGHHHWDTPHAPDCHNPAFTVRRTGLIVRIAFCVRNTGTTASPNDVTINLYTATRNKAFASTADVDIFVQNLLAVGAPIAPSPWQNQIVPGRSRLSDTPWSPPGGIITWSVPPGTRFVVLVATVQSLSLGQMPSLPNTPTQDACVGVWVGP